MKLPGDVCVRTVATLGTFDRAQPQLPPAPVTLACEDFTAAVTPRLPQGTRVARQAQGPAPAFVFCGVTRR